jgi:hypothetical protein
VIAGIVVLLVSLVLFLFVIVFALYTKDSVCAALRFRTLGFFLEAKNNSKQRSRDELETTNRRA